MSNLLVLIPLNSGRDTDANAARALFQAAVLIPLNSGRDTDTFEVGATTIQLGLNPFEFRA